MDNEFFSFSITGFKRVKQQVLNWANRFGTCCFLDNHEYCFSHGKYECLAAAGARHTLTAQAGTALEQLEQFRQQHSGWLFGHLGYDLKNETEPLQSALPDRLGFPDLFFFVPETVVTLSQRELRIHASDAKKAARVFDAIQEEPAAPSAAPGKMAVPFRSRLTRQAYLETVEKLRGHILRGDCYEINFCQEFFAENISIDPLSVYRLLSLVSPAPFAAFYKHDDKYLLCASPERYLKKKGDILISQPIKGTAKRNLTDALADNHHKTLLRNSTKECSENVMVVDLVRNDLSRICQEGSVKVEELLGVYSFPQVHQLVSTITGILPPRISFADIIAATFPMGSMTGAPKKKVMELIEQYETSRRGIFSGALGYIEPGGDFDLNVVIRSIFYNASRQYLSFLVGSGITFYSDAAAEYEECLLKAAAIKEVFGLA